MDTDDYLFRCIRRYDNEEAQRILTDLNPREIFDSSKATLLHVAAACGNAIMTKYLIDRGCEVDALDDLGNTPLILASKRINKGVIRELIGASASTSITNERGESAAKIILGGDTLIEHECLNAFLERIKDECSNDSLRTAEELLKAQCQLSRAMLLKDTAITKYMLEHGRNVDDRDTDFPYFTALQLAISLWDIDGIKLLINHGADVDATVILEKRGDNGPMSFFPSSLVYSRYLDKNLEIFEILIDHGASLNVKGFARLLLKYLLQYGTRETVKFLLQLDLGKENRRFRLLRYLVSNINFDPVDEIENLKLNINARRLRGKGASALSCAITVGNAKSMKFLLDKGDDPHAVGIWRLYPALFYAFDRVSEDFVCPTMNNLRCVKVLLEHGVDVQCVCPYFGAGYNTLFYFFRCVKSKNYEAMKFVLARLAVVEAQGDEIRDFITAAINSNAIFKRYFEVCRRKIRKMKQTLIHDLMSQFEFVTVGKVEVIMFVRNKSLLSRLKSMVNYKRRSRFYCYVLLRERAMKAVEIANLRESAFDAVAEIQGLQQNAYVIRKIADYYIHDELKNVALA